MKLLARAGLSIVVITTLSAGATTSAVPAKPDDKAILHVLNRIGFGARPGDVARVREMGLAKYIDEQLTPERIPDSAMASRLAGFETLDMNSRTLAKDYYMPAQMARRQAQQANAKNQTTAPADPQREPRTPEQM